MPKMRHTQTHTQTALIENDNPRIRGSSYGPLMNWNTAHCTEWNEMSIHLGRRMATYTCAAMRNNFNYIYVLQHILSWILTTRCLSLSQHAQAQTERHAKLVVWIFCVAIYCYNLPWFSYGLVMRLCTGGKWIQVILMDKNTLGMCKMVKSAEWNEIRHRSFVEM